MKSIFSVIAFLCLSFGIANAQQKVVKATKTTPATKVQEGEAVPMTKLTPAAKAMPMTKLVPAEQMTKEAANDKVVKNTPNPVFVTKDYDFGKINESDERASTVFTFTNEGDVPFVIERAVASCGCTTPKYNKEPILPGKKGTITVTYSTIGRIGVFEKQIQLFTNIPYPNNVITLIIRGEVLRDS